MPPTPGHRQGFQRAISMSRKGVEMIGKGTYSAPVLDEGWWEIFPLEESRTERK